MRKVSYMYEDGDGAFAIGCKNKEEARVELQETIDDYINDGVEDDERVIVNIENIQEAIAYPSHMKCNGGYMIGENICYECGETTTRKGIPVYTYAI